MRFSALKWHWERLGRRDPFWAVLADPDKRHGGWNLDQFFRSGIEEIAAVLQRAEQLGLSVSRVRGLDFGCGVGRLTQAIAGQFERCDGVDISRSMLRAARRYNRHADRCSYHLNPAPDLSLFADASFSFVYSTLVLQHMEPRYSTGYIRELLRVLADGGLLVFQLPSHRAAEEPSAAAARTRIPGRLPAAAFNARLVSQPSTLSVRAAERVTLKVTVENCSPRAWPALPSRWARHTINLANHWLHEDGALLQRDDARCPLPYDLAPGARAELMLGVTAPAFDGQYWIELDLVQEDVGWFAQRGSETIRIPCCVSGGLPGPPPRQSAREVAARGPESPFRERHPQVFGVLRATRLRDLYWAWRHAVDRVKARRDRLIWALKAYAYEPVIPPLINWWKGRPFAARIDMYCVPRSEVLEILAKAGGRVVDVEEELVIGGFQSYRYWVTKTTMNTGKST